MLTNTVKDQIPNAILKIEEEIGEKAKKLQDQQSDNIAAWEMYGSELCAGEMQGKENEIHEEIVRLGEQRELLRSVLSGELDVSPEHLNELHIKVEKINNSISHLEKKRNSIQEEFDSIAKALMLISRHS